MHPLSLFVRPCRPGLSRAGGGWRREVRQYWVFKSSEKTVSATVPRVALRLPGYVTKRGTIGCTSRSLPSALRAMSFAAQRRADASVE